MGSTPIFCMIYKNLSREGIPSGFLFCFMQYVMGLIRYIGEKVGIADSQESWRSYDRMNKKIIEKLDKTQL